MQAWLRSRQQQIKLHPILTAFIAVASVLLIALIVVIILGYFFKWEWTGINNYSVPITTNATKTTLPTNITVTLPYKTLYDWLQLLGIIAIPVVVGLGAAWFTARQNHDREIAEEQRKTDMKIARDRYEADYKLALANQHEAALQTYIDKMSELLLKEHLGERTEDGQLIPEYEGVRKIARLRTITVLTQLDARRIGNVIAFLREAGLMSTTSDDNIVSLSGADLRGVNWSQADLSHANLNYTNLSGADLSGANLSEAFIIEAKLNKVNLNQADLSGANLSNSYLGEVNLSNADLSEANLRRANLHNADLRNADLSAADLKDAKNITNEELERQAASLQGTTMPDGTIHP